MSNGGEIIHGFRIFISLPMDDVCTLKGLTPDMYVYQLKSRVELKAGIPGDIFNLVFMNVQLSEQQTLKSYHLKHGCIVRVQIESNSFGLFEACWRGDIYHVFENGVQFLDVDKLKGYNIDLWNKLVVHRATHALFIACHRGYLGLILELINRGATDINGKTIFGRTALHVAAYQGFVGCVSLLLSEGAICNQIDINGKTSLALAAENGHIYCEKRLLLYQWNLQSPFERSSRSSIAESEAERETKSASPRTTNERVVDSAGHDNNVRQGTKAFDFHLPRVSINTSVKQQMHLSKNADPARLGRHPFPLVQIAEKYKRELREYNERTGNFPRVQDDESTSETRYQKRTWDHNVETVLAAKDTSKTLSSDEKKQNTKEPCDAETGISQKDLELMDEANKRNETVVQDMDSRDLALDTGVQDQENIRPSSGKMAVIRKLDIVMSAVDSSGHLKGGEKPNTDLERNGIDSEKKEGEMRIDFQDCSRKKPAQTFEHWIVMKRAQLRNRPCTAPAPNSKLGKSIDPESFKKWLNSKRLHRPNTSSESSAAPKKKFISSGGITYDHWLKTKTSKRPRSAVNHMPVGNSRDDITGAKDKMRRQILTGKSFELWLAEKKKGSQTLREGECNEDKYKHVSKRGKSFEVWLQDKRNQQQIELIQKMTAEKEDQKRKELEQFQKWFNPHYKSFDDWLAIKSQEVILNRVKAQNEPAKEQEIPAEEKEKDVKVVFDIWQTMKALKELSDEEKKYDEMKAKWAAKKREREQFQRLNTINKLKMRTTRQR